MVYTEVFAALPVEVAALLRCDWPEARTFVFMPRLVSGRLASLAASICSGVRTSGSDSLTCSFARATWRLCRFASRLSILQDYTEVIYSAPANATLQPFPTGIKTC